MQAITQVLQRRQFAAQAVGVPQERHAREVRRRVAAHLLALRIERAAQRAQQAGQHAQEAGLAAAIGALHMQELAGMQLDIHRAQSLGPAARAAARTAQPACREQGRRGVSGPPSPPLWAPWLSASRQPSGQAEYAAAYGRCPCGNRCRSWSCRPDRSSACSARARFGA
ncbi:hypothetical protein G6F62_013992 [Rhizopus arrhizus]|nr:hypothetical protein G6F62_013992 [Rhizopus arrhizus]